ncbi:Protein of uncharacterised function (DUF3575) [uncultured Bacteroides sp.]|uniref:DUF3575 domain-containing protein n=1 Tax=Bacteroides cellulolyticus TaxID=2981780 RepID=UPI000822AAA9|nr:DUF3575 domain-containing protein [Bacteroides cellulolyticus]MCU6772408.1 DUF3575 domain-containing protein [Bacteroides cellulolyticus]SCI36865.1 Protein of uncharacterised function (DUF3575) [uncultured Bacteroides sp.]
MKMKYNMIANLLFLSVFMTFSCNEKQQIKSEHISLAMEEKSTSDTDSFYNATASFTTESEIMVDNNSLLSENNEIISNEISSIKEEEVIEESNVEYNVSGSELKSTDTYSYQKPLKTKGTKTRINIGKKVEKESVKKESTDKKSVKDTGIAKRYVSVKTNFAYWAGAVANLSADIQLHRKLSLELPFDWSLWDIEREHGVRLVLFQPEVRWWMKNVGKGHFVGVHAHAGVFNVKWKDIRYQTAGRPLLGAGLTYGYSLPFSEHWGAEFLLGVGYANMKFDEFYNIDNGAKICTDELNYWGITKLGISLVYRF